jgi:2-dehydro-3-deoxyphosphogalactonate aldolase
MEGCTMTTRLSFSQVLSELPLIAIIRGIEPHEAIPIAMALRAAGFRCLEVPLNSPQALKSIEAMRDHFEGKLLIGAGTVLRVAEVAACRAAGAEFIVSPNTDAPVIAAAKACGLISIPGFLTPSEAFIAINAGADALKLFPAETVTPAVLRALKAVIPKLYPILPVGGISASNMQPWVKAGAAGFGIGSELYKVGTSPQQVQERAASFVSAWACGTR